MDANTLPKEEFRVPKNEIMRGGIEVMKRITSGINYDVKYVASLTVQDQAEYADLVTKKYATNPHFKRDCGTRFDPNTPVARIRGWDATAIGNTAYSSLHSPEPYRTESKQWLELICKTFLS